MRFTLRRDPWRRLSACVDGPSGRNVDRRVDVRVRPMPAGDASEDRLALAVLRRAMPTDAAGLRRVRGVDLLDPPGCLVLQTTYQRTPGIDHNATVEPRLGTAPIRQVSTWTFEVGFDFGSPDHLGDPKVFHPDHGKSSGEVGAGLLHPILATISGSGVQLRDRRLHSPTPVRSTAASGQTALQVLEPCLLARRQAWAGEKFASTQCGRYRNASVDTDDLARSRRGDRLRDDGEGDVPATRTIASDAIRLRSRYCPGQSEPHPADLRDEHLRPLPAQLHDPRCLTTDDAESLVMLSLAPGRPPVSASVEVPYGLVEVPQSLLLHGLRARPQPTERGSGFGQLARLFDVRRCRTSVAAPHRPLLKRQIPQVSRMPALLQQGSLLRWSRVQAESRHSTNPITQDRQFPISEGRQSRHFLAMRCEATPRPTR